MEAKGVFSSIIDKDPAAKAYTKQCDRLSDHVGLIGTASTDLHINGELVMSGDQDPHIFAVQMQELADAIIENRESWVKLEQIITQLRIIEAARKAVKLGKAVDL